MPSVALRERDGFGYSVPPATLGLRHTYLVTDCGERLVRGAALLPCTGRTGWGLAVFEYLKQGAMNAANLSGHRHGLCGQGSKVRCFAKRVGYAGHQLAISSTWRTVIRHTAGVPVTSSSAAPVHRVW